MTLTKRIVVTMMTTMMRVTATSMRMAVVIMVLLITLITMVPHGMMPVVLTMMFMRMCLFLYGTRSLVQGTPNLPSTHDATPETRIGRPQQSSGISHSGKLASVGAACSARAFCVLQGDLASFTSAAE